MSNIVPTGMEGMDLLTAQQESDLLHFEKNKPDLPMINGRPIRFPAYTYRPFPAAMYDAWTEETQRLAFRRHAASMQLNVNIPDQRALAGLSLRYWEGSDIMTDQHPSRLDVIYGFKTQRADWAVRIQS
jgi:hypothetical protein